jgi:hypothetical protein
MVRVLITGFGISVFDLNTALESLALMSLPLCKNDVESRECQSRDRVVVV